MKRTADLTNQSGFTLIELIMVIVILGILAAVALPKFADVSTDARQAAADNLAASLTSANSNNLALANIPGKGATVASGTTCLAAASLIADVDVGDLTITGNVVASTAAGNNCTVSGTNITSATATINSVTAQ